jgi:thioredoxin reductase (NADPH)
MLAAVTEKSEAITSPTGEALISSDPDVRDMDAFPTLSPDQVERIVAFGAVESLPLGCVLFEIGDRRVDFFVVLNGFVEVYIGRAGANHVMYTHREHQFTGELNIFNDRAVIAGGRMGVAGHVGRLNFAQLRRMLAAEPDIADVVMRAFIHRRERFIRHSDSAVTIIAPRRSADSVQLQRFLTRNRHPFLLTHPDRGSDAEVLLREKGLTIDDTPVVLCGDDRAMLRPSTRLLADRLGIAELPHPQHVADVVVVGAGPAGLAAAVYAASEGLDTVVVEADAPGGQASTSSRIENYLGFPLGISGGDLAHCAQVQAQKFGARIVLPRHVIRLDTDTRPYTLELDDGAVLRGRTVVLATGARYRRLQLDGIAKFEGAGVQYAATAVEAALCEGDAAVVVGGGNSAGQAAIFLSRHATHVHVVVRRPDLQSTMSEYLIRRIEASERITVHPHTEITGVAGDRHVQTVTWRHRLTGASHTGEVANIFLMLGAEPNTQWLGNCVALDEKGFVQTGASIGAERAYGNSATQHPLATTCPGIFAVGDVRSGSVKRVASGVGEGSVVVAAVHQALADDAPSLPPA